MVYFLGDKVQGVSERHVQVNAPNLKDLICAAVEALKDSYFLLHNLFRTTLLL